MSLTVLALDHHNDDAAGATRPQAAARASSLSYRPEKVYIPYYRYFVTYAVCDIGSLP